MIKATRPGYVPMFDPATNMTTYETTPDDWDPAVHYAGTSYDDEQEEEQEYDVYHRIVETMAPPLQRQPSYAGVSRNPTGRPPAV